MITMLFLAASLAVQPVPNQPVAVLDLARYSGSWHEIARFEQSFQKKCVGDVTAHYSLRDDGRIRVINRCRTRDGSMSEAEGEARRVDGQPGALKVRFAPRWLSWLPFVWGDYWVIALDPDYGWTLIGSPSRDYLWILSRTPRLAPETYDAIVAKAKARGYDVSKLIASNRPQ